jgi:signal transduction histidine kinase
MTAGGIFDASLPKLLYALVFAVATLGCGLALIRARRVHDAETRRGLVGLLVTSGLWAASHAAVLLVPGRSLKVALYIGGLIVGFATVFVWLYFCSAYTGRIYHRQSIFRRAGVGLYLAVVAVKLTNPLHHQYFTTAFVTEPFPHLAILQGSFHWLVTGLSYTLAALGIFLLFELFAEADYDTRPLAVLVGVTASPIVLDLIGEFSTLFVNMIHAPLGVALFAIGVLYVYEERFLAVQLTGTTDQPVVFLDDGRRVQEYTERARELFPGLSGAIGQPAASIPRLADTLDADDEVVAVPTDGETRYYAVYESAFGLGRVDVGELRVFTDVTPIERQRRELVRHNDQLESFAVGIRHELRNAITVVGGHVDAAAAALERGEADRVRESLRTASETADRMSDVVSDFAVLAQYGQTVTETDRLDFRTAVERGVQRADADLALTVEGDGTVEASGNRLERLFENAAEFARHNGASSVVVRLREDGFTITDDGDPPMDRSVEAYFDYGDAVPNARAGTALPLVRTFGTVHGWSVTIDTDYADGIRVVVSDVVVSFEGDTPDDGTIPQDGDANATEDGDATAPYERPPHSSDGGGPDG